jgi:hypothetical protein
LNGSKIAVPVPVEAYGERAIPYIPIFLLTLDHDDVLYKFSDNDNFEIPQVTCLHFKSELRETLQRSRKSESDIPQPQKFFDQLMENYDLYY